MRTRAGSSARPAGSAHLAQDVRVLFDVGRVVVAFGRVLGVAQVDEVQGGLQLLVHVDLLAVEVEEGARDRFGVGPLQVRRRARRGLVAPRHAIAAFGPDGTANPLLVLPPRQFEPMSRRTNDGLLVRRRDPVSQACMVRPPNVFGVVAQPPLSETTADSS